MRLVRYAAATAGLTMAALASGAPAALASDPSVRDKPSALMNDTNVSVTPNPSAPGTSTTFQASCASQSSGGPANSATLNGSSLGLAAQIQMQPGTQSNQFVVTVNLPQTIGAGSFSPNINCNNGVTQTVNIQVNAVPGQAPATGDGTTSTATDSTLMVAGLGLLAAASVGGGLVLRRRSRRHV
jgi:hypothetical protein